MAQLTLDNCSLKIELGFWERLGSFSRNQSIRISDIAEVSQMEKVAMSIFGYRVVGTGLPGVVVLGHFRKSKKRMMVYWVRGQQALILDLKAGPYQRLIIGCSDAKALAKELSLAV
ncbi:MAG: hypothetical protein NTW23_04930 [Rhodoluna sp.]|nr:hypothetical protein [Rhodoluna sp.]